MRRLLIPPERVAIGLCCLGIALTAHPLRVALRIGQDDRALALGIGAHGLRRLGAFAAVLPRLLFTLGLHAGVDSLAVLFRKISAPQTHIDDLDPERPGLSGD